MKKQNWWLTMIAAILMSSNALGQSQNLTDETQFYLLHGYFEGHEVHGNGNLDTNNIYYVTTKIKVYPSLYEKTINGVKYIFITYPRFTKLKKDSSDSTQYRKLWHHNDKTIAIKKATFDTLKKEVLYNNKLFSTGSYKFVTGQLTVPFKLRPATNGQKFQLTTDVTLGAYGGIRKRLSKRQDVFVTIPATLGLSYINLNSNNTTLTSPTSAGDDRVVPGVSWSSGLLFQFNKFNAGFVFGKDYASQVASDWIYHDKLWYSFAIGYSFSTSN